MKKKLSPIQRVKNIGFLDKIVESPGFKFVATAVMVTSNNMYLTGAIDALFQMHSSYYQQALIDLVLEISKKVEKLEEGVAKLQFEQRVSSREGYVLSLRIVDAVIRQPDKAELLGKYFVNALSSDLAQESISAYMDVVEQLRPLDIRILHGAVNAKRKNTQEGDRKFSWHDVNKDMPEVDAGVFHHGVRKLETLALINQNDAPIKEKTHFLTSFGESVYDFFSK